MRKAMLVILASAVLAFPAQAAKVQVEVTGQVEYNLLRAFPLNEAQAGDPVSLKFQVDSDRSFRGEGQASP